MIDIINGFLFKRNHDNTVYFPVSNFASLLGEQPYTMKEHYFLCVKENCFSEGEVHIEAIENGELEVYIPLFSVKEMILSLEREGFIVADNKRSCLEMLVKSMSETQEIVSDSFDRDFYNDRIRKLIPTSIPPVSDSISRNTDN